MLPTAWNPSSSHLILLFRTLDARASRRCATPTKRELRIKHPHARATPQLDEALTILFEFWGAGSSEFVLRKMTSVLPPHSTDIKPLLPADRSTAAMPSADAGTTPPHIKHEDDADEDDRAVDPTTQT